MADLAVWQRTIVDEEGNVVPGAEVEVRREEDGSLATLYADRAGETPLANPLAADMSGFVRFFAQGDAYTITAVGAGSTRTWRFDPTGRLKEFDRISDALAVDDGADTAEARSLLGTFTTVADVENSHIPPVLDSIRTNGYHAPGDGGGALYVRVGSEPSHAGKIQSNDGAWWEIAEKVVTPQMFGVRTVPEGEDDITVAQARDCTTAWNACSEAAKLLNLAVDIPAGRYAHSGTLKWREGVLYRALSGGNNWRPSPTSSGVSMPYPLYADAQGVIFIAIGEFSKDFTVPDITACRQLGIDRPNPARLFNNNEDAEFLVWDGTNEDANEEAPATLRAFSVAHHFDGNSEQRFSITGGPIFIPNCPDPSEEPGGFGLGGYGVKDQVVPWADVDIGVFCESPWNGDIEVVVAGYYNDLGALVTPNVKGQRNRGYAEHNVFSRCLIQGGTAIRAGDTWPIVAKTANSVSVRWTPSHTFASTGTLWIGESAYSYSSYSYSGLQYDDSGDFPVLTFTGISDTGSVIVNSHHIVRTLGAGFALSIARDCEFYDWSHSTGVEHASPEFGSRARRYQPALQVVGHPIRAFRFDNCIIHAQGPWALALAQSWDLMFTNCWSETRTQRQTVGGPSVTRGAAAICGPRSDMRDEVGGSVAPNVRFYGRTFHPSIARGPMRSSGNSYRFGNNLDDDFFNPEGYFDEYEMMVGHSNNNVGWWGARNGEIDLRTRDGDSGLGTLRRVLRAVAGKLYLGSKGNNDPILIIPDYREDETSVRVARNLVPDSTSGGYSLGTPERPWRSVRTQAVSLLVDQDDIGATSGVAALWVDNNGQLKIRFPNGALKVIADDS